LLALEVGKRAALSDFLVPLKIETLRVDEITFTFQTINYISFTDGWATGLARVIKKLETLNCPRALAACGAALAAKIPGMEQSTAATSERLFSNCLPILAEPRVLRVFSCEREMSRQHSREARQQWSHYWLTPSRVVAFDDPPSSIVTFHRLSEAATAEWRTAGEVMGVKATHLATSLARQAVAIHLNNKGLQFDVPSKAWFFPDGLVQGNWLRFAGPDGKPGRLLAVGTVTHGSGPRKRQLRHHLAPSLDTWSDQGCIRGFLLRLRVHLTGLDGSAIPSRSYLTARKKLCKRWWNLEWLRRALAVFEFLKTDDTRLVLGSNPDTAFVLSAIPTQLMAPVSVVEAAAIDIDIEPFLVQDRDDADDS
jgi:hypothetical protein